MLTEQQLYLFFADAVLMIHFGCAFFLIGGLGAIWAGWFWGWSFVHNCRFRIAHLLVMGDIVCKAVFDLPCPLTIWEEELRLLAGSVSPYGGECVHYWVRRLLFCDLSANVIAIIYGVFFLLMLSSVWLVPMRRPARRAAAQN